VTKYPRQIALAKRLIAEKGTLVTWQKRGVAMVGGTAAKPAGAVAPVLIENVPMVFLPSKGSGGLAALFSMMGGDNVDIPASGTRALLAPFVGLETLTDLSPNDLIQFGDVTYSISPQNGIEALAPDGVPVLFFLRLIL